MISMHRHISYRVFFAMCALLQIFTFGAMAQERKVSVTVEISQGPNALVKGAGFKDSTSFGFLKSSAGATGLEKRISGLKFFDSAGREVGHRELQAGEFLTEEPASGWSYVIDLSPPEFTTAAAHISWIGEDAGLLMAADMLPMGIGEGPAEFTVELPVGWKTATSGKTFSASSADDAVVFISKDAVRTPAGRNAFVNMAGNWHFTPTEAAEMAEEIAAEYSKVFGSVPEGAIEVNILPFPAGANHGTWQAETRGRTVTIVSADMAFRTQSLQRLHEQLRHELFHLWIPNGVNLTGNYDWFYEGFALYQSLRMAMGVNRIGFNDMLSTLSRAHAIAERQRGSLLEASKTRWAPGGTEVYALGMFTAFLTDLAMLTSSGGKQSVEDLLKEIYSRHHDGESVDGNEAVLAAMERRPELRRIIERYIRGGERIDEKALLRSAGVVLGQGGLKAVEKPSGRQKAILNRLGYNNWRRSPKFQK